MLFRRRMPLSLRDRLRLAVRPEKGWRRALRYLGKRILRLGASPHAIAAGVAAGTFASFTPFIGFHFILGFAVAYLVGGNMAAAALGTAIGNPLTFPLIWLSSYEVGASLLGGGATDASADLIADLASRPLRALLPIIEPLTLGALVLGGFFSLVAYLIVRSAVIAYQRGRRQRLAARRAAQNDDGWAV